MALPRTVLYTKIIKISGEYTIKKRWLRDSISHVCARVTVTHTKISGEYVIKKR